MRTRFVVIGYGHIGRRHAALIAAHPGAELVATVDPAVAGNAEGVAHRTSLDELLARGPAGEVACVCTPNGLHAPQAIRLLEAGWHAVVEKPLALTVADCDAMLAAAARHGRHVFGVMQNRFSPASRWLKDRLDEGRLGRILQVHVDCFWNRDARYYRGADGSAHPWHGHPTLDGGVLFTQFAHFVDLLCWCFGVPRVVAARTSNQHHRDIHEFADGGSALLDFGGGAAGSINFSTAVWDRNFESTLTVIGERGTVKLGGQYMNELRYCHVDGLAPPTLPPSRPANNYGPYTGSAANHHFVIDNVIDVLAGRAAVACTAAEGRAVVGLIAAITRAAAAPARPHS